MEKIPKYFIFRILLVAVFFQFLLVLPPFVFSVLNIVPENSQIVAGKSNSFEFAVNSKDYKRAEKAKGIIYLISLLIFIAINVPFKIYLNHLRKNKPISPFIKKYSKKLLQYTPYINSFIFISIAIYIALFYFLSLPSLKQSDIQMFHFTKQLIIISIFASLLVSLVIFLWQENRVRLNYLPYFFDEEELKSMMKSKNKSTSLYGNFMLSAFVTTFLPIVIMLFYIFLNISNVNEVVNTEQQLSTQQTQILFGKYSNIYQKIKNTLDTEKNKNNENKKMLKFLFGHYLNSVNTFFMVSGILLSIIVAIFYILLITKLNTRLVVLPIQELMRNIKKTTAGEFGLYTVVRTRNEIGVIAESFNKMSAQLKEYFDDLNELNKNLEQKVIERTAKIEQQKEEIKAQKDEITAQRDEVILQRDYISSQNRQITDSINYAKNIQQAILPSISHLEQIFPKYFLFFKPKDIVSGDFYWISETEKEKIIVVADCTGHGVPGAMMSMLGVSSLNEIISAKKYKNTADILERLRKKVIKSLNISGADKVSKDGMDMSIVILNKKNMTIQYSGAYNSIYIVSDRKINFKNQDSVRIMQIDNSHKILYEIRADKMPVGVHIAQMKAFSYQNIKIAQGDRIFLFSDGFPDLFNWSRKQKFSTKRFKNLLIETSALPIDKQHEKIEQAYDNWLDGMQIDDILLLAFEV